MRKSSWLWTLLAVVGFLTQVQAVSARSAQAPKAPMPGEPIPFETDLVSFSEPKADETPSQGLVPADPTCGCSGTTSCDSSNDRLRFAYADPCPKINLYAMMGVESWRGISDGISNNNGGFAGLNLGTPVPWLSKWGIGWQLGGTTGTYDWMGRATNGYYHASEPQSQSFITTGFFRRANEESPWSGGIVYDMMLNGNFGTVAQNPTLGQWRAQIGYALSGRNEIGFWGTWRERDATCNYFTPELPVTYQPIGQVNAYWHHKMSENGADTWLWVGLPSQSRLNPAFGGVLHDVTFGAAASVPMNDRLALAGNFQYAKAAASQSVVASMEEAFDISISLVFYPGRTAQSRTVAGRSWMPLLPVANNGNFLVDRTP